MNIGIEKRTRCFGMLPVVRSTPYLPFILPPFLSFPVFYHTGSPVFTLSAFHIFSRLADSFQSNVFYYNIIICMILQ